MGQCCSGCFVIIMMMMLGVIVAVFLSPSPNIIIRNHPLAASVGVMQICIQLSTFTRHKMKCDNQIRPTTMRSKGSNSSSSWPPSNNPPLPTPALGQIKLWHCQLARPTVRQSSWPTSAIAIAIRVPVYAILIVL